MELKHHPQCDDPARCQVPEFEFYHVRIRGRETSVVVPSCWRRRRWRATPMQEMVFALEHHTGLRIVSDDEAWEYGKEVSKKCGRPIPRELMPLPAASTQSSRYYYAREVKHRLADWRACTLAGLVVNGIGEMAVCESEQAVLKALREIPGITIMRSGLPDFWVSLPDGTLRCIEVKSGSDQVRANQKAAMRILARAGIRTHVLRVADNRDEVDREALRTFLQA